MKLKNWTLLYGGAVVCSLLCLGLVYLITVTGDISYEAIIYVLMVLLLGLAGGGYYLESKYKKEHPEEFDYDSPEEE
jgi:hypothetical protein